MIYLNNNETPYTEELFEKNFKKFFKISNL